VLKPLQTETGGKLTETREQGSEASFEGGHTAAVFTSKTSRGLCFLCCSDEDTHRIWGDLPKGGEDTKGATRQDEKDGLIGGQLNVAWKKCRDLRVSRNHRVKQNLVGGEDMGGKKRGGARQLWEKFLGGGGSEIGVKRERSDRPVDKACENSKKNKAWGTEKGKRFSTETVTERV